MNLVIALILLGAPDPMDIHAGDFIDMSPASPLILASAAYRNEDWLSAAAEYLNALTIDPDDSIVIYKLACCYGLMGEENFSALYLRRAFTAGFNNIDLANSDPDFYSVRELPVFTALIDSLNQVSSETEASLGELHWFDAVQSFSYRVRFPDSFNPPEEMPVVIGLHGLGESPEGLTRLWEMIDEPQFIYVVPRAPYLVGDDAFAWFRGENGTEEWGHSLLLAGEYVFALVEQVKREYPVSDVYLLGFSQGACLALYSGLNQPEMFKAVIASSGWLADDFIPENLITQPSAMRIELMHSIDDREVPFEAAEEAETVLSQLGWDIELHRTGEAYNIVFEELNLILYDLGLTGTD